MREHAIALDRVPHEERLARVRLRRDDHQELTPLGADEHDVDARRLRVDLRADVVEPRLRAHEVARQLADLVDHLGGPLPAAGGRDQDHPALGVRERRDVLGELVHDDGGVRVVRFLNDLPTEAR